RRQTLHMRTVFKFLLAVAGIAPAACSGPSPSEPGRCSDAPLIGFANQGATYRMNESVNIFTEGVDRARQLGARAIHVSLRPDRSPHEGTVDSERWLSVGSPLEAAQRPFV